MASSPFSSPASIIEGPMQEGGNNLIVRVRDLQVGFGPHMVLKGLDLDVKAGEVMGFVGGSGQGKSVLTRTILGLLQKTSGEIEVFGEDLDSLSTEEHRVLERR